LSCGPVIHSGGFVPLGEAIICGPGIHPGGFVTAVRSEHAGFGVSDFHAKFVACTLSVHQHGEGGATLLVGVQDSFVCA
jgi:hypothetical protein